ncbi:hypothetical protein FF011L_01380 [Roseimaritima multifibrata]|uniref:JAB domain-containing protein n=1 Tax=Roseimaritima multifibrata TaxID=1930274 RepID=A0A517M934_9BACT|nr:Mov34/MPN/PAD-1 family protein [Roseimaritima multifibrata]QDS91408.1 hypothetical protein FF011L_01380 [Roseimaritima multifibrata]
MQLDQPIRYAIANSDQCIVVETQVLEVFDDYRQDRCWKREAGGQLFAKLTNDEIVLKIATSPTRKDIRRRFQFIPFLKNQQEEINSQFESGLFFVGDWHTHPQTVPEMSPEDRESMADCFVKSSHGLDAFLMVIVGTRPFPEGLSVSIHRERDFAKATLVS